MSYRSINGFTANIRSLNGLEGVAIETVLGGEAISITDTSKSKKTINVDISKQNAVTTIADDDVFLLENASGTIKKITGVNLKDSCDGFFFLNSSVNIIADNTSDNLVIGESSNPVGYKLLIGGTSRFNGNIDVADLSSFNGSLSVGNGSTSAGFVKFSEKSVGGILNSGTLKVLDGLSGNHTYTLPDLTGNVCLLNSLSASPPIVYNNSTGGFTFDNTSTGFITLSSLSASAPIVYNNSTGAFTFNNSTTNFITLSSLSATSPLSYNNSTGAFTTTFTPTSTTNMSGKTFTDMPTFNEGLAVKYTPSDTVSGFIRFTCRRS